VVRATDAGVFLAVSFQQSAISEKQRKKHNAEALRRKGAEKDGRDEARLVRLIHAEDKFAR
jgi:hypothetical protein